MLLDIIFMRGDHVILRDMDGSEVALTAEDADLIRAWLNIHWREIQAIMVQQEKKRKEGQTGRASLSPFGDQG